jgi:hypothetical protein
LNLFGALGTSSIWMKPLILTTVFAVVLGFTNLFGKENEAISFVQYSGVYQAPENKFVSIATFDPGDGEKRLLFTDLESGLIRAFTRAENDVFTAGPGLLTPTPIQFQLQFRRNEHGEIIGLAGDGKGFAKEARKLGARRQEMTIRNGEIALTGTLVRPAAEKQCPAVVFLHGSGALNRYSFGPLPDFFPADLQSSPAINAA